MDSPPDVKRVVANTGYNQTYIIQKLGHHSENSRREVFFRCGNWYGGFLISMYFYYSTQVCCVYVGLTKDSFVLEICQFLSSEWSMIVSPYNTFLSPLCSRNLPNIIPVLQNQQANLTFLCESNTVPEESIFF